MATHAWHNRVQAAKAFESDSSLDHATRSIRLRGAEIPVDTTATMKRLRFIASEKPAGPVNVQRKAA